MGGWLSGYGDVIEFTYPNPEDPYLDWRRGRGFLDFVRNLSDEQIIEYAKLYVAWRDKRLRECGVVRIEREREDGEVEREYRVYVPRLRYLRRNYYGWIKELELPRAYYRFITLTFSRDRSIVEVWKNVNKWISKCLHRVRNELRRKYQAEMYYMWVVECHKDGYPHVHIIWALNRYIEELKFEDLLKMFQKYWVDDAGRALCAPQGVDIRYAGTEVEDIKRYLLKYLVKDQSGIWGIEVERGLVRARLCALLIWAFKVKLFGISKKLKNVMKMVSSGRCEWLGKTSVYRLWRFSDTRLDLGVFVELFLSKGSYLIDEDKVLLLIGPSLVLGAGGGGGLVYH
jgi:hypothetical protein